MNFVKVLIPSAVGGDHRPWVAGVSPLYTLEIHSGFLRMNFVKVLIPSAVGGDHRPFGCGRKARFGNEDIIAATGRP
jgi:hypothetical protein